MGYKGLRIVGFLSLLASAGCLGLLTSVFGSMSEAETSTVRLFGQGFGLVFTLLGQLSLNASSLLESQADQIVRLEREIADLRPPVQRSTAG